MEARNELIRLLKEDCNGGGRHERLFFEVARKTATFADFCRAFHAHSYVLCLLLFLIHPLLCLF